MGVNERLLWYGLQNKVKRKHFYMDLWHNAKRVQNVNI